MTIGATITTETHIYRLDGWNVRVQNRDAENYGHWFYKFSSPERELYEAMTLSEKFATILERVEHITQ